MCQSYLSLGQNNKDKWQPFSKMPPINLYAELNSQLAQIENQDAIGLGFKGGVTWSPNSAVGFSFTSTINKYSPTREVDDRVYLKNVHTGLYYEYMWKPNNRVHFIVPVELGVGECFYEWRDIKYYSGSSYPYGEQYYFYLEPTAKLEFNLSERFRINAGVSYTLVPQEFEFRTITNSSLSVPSLEIGIRYGRFFQ